MCGGKATQETLLIGKTVTVFGVRGWLKLISYTEQPESIFSYQPWLIGNDQQQHKVTVDAWKHHGSGLIAHLAGIDDRDIARTWCRKNIRISKFLLPTLSDRDLYWYQLEGLSVTSCYEGQQKKLGIVKCLMETGANDVLVVTDDDSKERLIPYAEQFITNIDLNAGTIDVVWDPEF
jgi:16S rRNA processing protein RimM